MNHKLWCPNLPFLCSKMICLPIMLHLDLESFIRSHLKLAVIQTANWADRRGNIQLPIYTYMNHVSLRPPYTSCLSIHSCIFLSYGSYVVQMHFACYARNFWCEMKNLGQVWKSFICQKEASAWYNALQFQKFPPRAFLVAFEASHAACVAYEAYTGPIERSPLFSLKFPPACNPLLTCALTPFFPHIRDNVAAFQVAVSKTPL